LVHRGGLLQNKDHPQEALGARTHEALLEAKEEALSKVSLADAAGWFDHCGYQVEVQYL
jgi:hypothetical protein